MEGWVAISFITGFSMVLLGMIGFLVLLKTEWRTSKKDIELTSLTEAASLEETERRQVRI
jgi:hypothetical protein